MSMSMLTILQLTGIFCAYLFASVGLPAFVFSRRLSGYRAPERFMLYFMTGNFFMMNLVFALQLLKISHPVTLILSTALLAVGGRFVVNDTPVRHNIAEASKYFRRVTGGQMGRHTAVYRTLRYLRWQLLRFGRWLGHFLVFRFFDCALAAFLLLLLWWMYGQNLLSNYGYKASDLIVHNYWINALNDNDIFVAGVYPHGFHCVIYYLHAVFGIETFDLLRLFAFVQNVMLHLMLLCVLRMCCKSRYLPYAGTILFVMGNYVKSHTYTRYYATLPQEFGIIFILPSAYFLFAFFEARRRELAAEKEQETGGEHRRRLFAGKRRRKSEKETAAETVQEQAAVREWEDDLEVGTSESQKVVQEKSSAASDEGKTERKSQRERREKTKTKEKTARERGWLWASVKERCKRFLAWAYERKKKHLGSDSWIRLAGFCMSFSMTLAVHFYGTMVAGLFCVGIAGGYCFVLFRKKYFWSVMTSGVLSVTIAVLPMLLAFLGGTPLQGSLGWGLNIIMGSSGAEEEESQGEVVELPEDFELPEDIMPGETVTVFVDGQEVTVTQDEDNNVVVHSTAPQEEAETQQLSFGERMSRLADRISARLDGLGKRAWAAFKERMSSYVFNVPNRSWYDYILYIYVGLVGLGFFYQLFRRQYCYGAMVASTGFYMLLLCVMMASGTFGLPSLMDASRGSIYFAYSAPVAFVIFADSVLYLPFFPFKNKVGRFMSHVLNLLSLACVCLALYYTVETNQTRSPRNPGGQEMNEAVVCLTNIVRTEPDFTWTIVSANDELRMGWDHGYHTETITFLEDMERIREDTMIRIPTPVVFFFIEKIPIDYNVAYENSGQSISEEGAAQRLPANSGIHMYQGEKRWILMSRMFYWAEEFKKSYPGEMEVYLETDQFICYRIEQNPYRLYNFAIDYGYNTSYIR